MGTREQSSGSASSSCRARYLALCLSLARMWISDGAHLHWLVVTTGGTAFDPSLPPSGASCGALIRDPKHNVSSSPVGARIDLAKRRAVSICVRARTAVQPLVGSTFSISFLRSDADAGSNCLSNFSRSPPQVGIQMPRLHTVGTSGNRRAAIIRLSDRAARRHASAVRSTSRYVARLVPRRLTVRDR